MTTLQIYLHQDRLRAIARGEILPDRTSGSALFADISGFIALTEGMHQVLSPRRRAEALDQAPGNRLHEADYHDRMISRQCH